MKDPLATRDKTDAAAKPPRPLRRIRKRILCVNAGSTSLKLSVVEPDDAATAVESLDAVPEGVAAGAPPRLPRGTPLPAPGVIHDAGQPGPQTPPEPPPPPNAPAPA